MKKQLNALFAVILACAFITSCSSSDNDDNNGSLILSTPEISFTGGNLTDKFGVQTEEKWSIGDLPTWVSASPASGTGNAEVTLTVLPHAALDGQERTAEIVIKIANVEKRLTVKQALSKKYLSKITRKIGVSGKPSSVSFTYNEDNTLLKYSMTDEDVKTTDIVAFEYDVDKRLIKATELYSTRIKNSTFTYKYIDNGTVESTRTDGEIPEGKDITVYTMSSNGYPTKTVCQGYYFKPEGSNVTTYARTYILDYVYNSNNTFGSHKETISDIQEVPWTPKSKDINSTYEYGTEGVHPLYNLPATNLYLLENRLPDNHLMITNIGAFTVNCTKYNRVDDGLFDTSQSIVYTYGDDKFPTGATLTMNNKGTYSVYIVEFEYIVK